MRPILSRASDASPQGGLAGLSLVPLLLLWLAGASLAAPASRLSTAPARGHGAIAVAGPTPPARGADRAADRGPDRVADRVAEGLSLDLAPLRRIAGQPPPPGSSTLHDDLAILRWLQANRSAELVAASWMTLARDPAVFAPAIGVDMAKSTPGIKRGLRQFLALVDGASNQIKQQVRRPRPYASHPDLKPCLPPETGFSFPSGHAGWYTAAAELLADLLPQRRERLLDMGRHGAASRVMCGVHYPSDVAAAQRLGRAAAAQIIASPQWRSFRLDPALQVEIQRVNAASPEVLAPLLR